ncbi:hypothetical protein [Streptomyces sp. L2]|uniref:hypothetical protein n=1 Tax=Streptomyces sp. L2 TaxID=2162665 RepID=UPI0010125177|nr:hypothetical protein [Streptomyces sp. L2]
MFVFVCAGCGAELTAPLAQVALPVHARQTYGNGLQLPVLMEPGTFAVDPEPSGPPWRTWEEAGPDEAAARGVYAPVHSLSYGPPGSVVIAPGDVRGTLLVPEKSGTACCGLAGADGPNMICEACGLAVATRIDDCSAWQAVWLDPGAVHRVPVAGADPVTLTWAELMAEGNSTPPFEPVTGWGGPRYASHYRWSWSPRWEAAAGRALAHLLVASEGRPVTVPGGLVGNVFQRSLDVLLPAGPPARYAVLAGPGLDAPETNAEILLVPVHPQTGEIWTPVDPARAPVDPARAPADPARAPADPARTPADPDRAAYPVPLPFGVWLWLAFPEPHLPAPTSGRMPDGVVRDDPPPEDPHSLFRADWRVFQRTLVRLPEVRRPWLRAILDTLTGHPYRFF